ncbi:MAG: sigma-70 family RNA polymerase sigma factor [Cyclobacteriaceae bacterium]
MKSIAKFRSLFEKHFTPLVKYSFSITGDKEQSKDIVQAFFVYMWKQNDIENLESFESYAFSSIKNKSLTFLKGQKKFSEEFPPMLVEHSLMSEKDTGFAKYLLESAIRGLPDKCREVFMLSKLEGLTYPEIADVLNISIKTVERQVGIGLKKLREVLAPHRELFLETIKEAGHE